MLCFKTESCSELIFCPSFKTVLTLHKITSIELQTWFCSKDIHSNPGFVSLNSSCVSQSCFSIGFKDKVVIISFTKFQLLIVIIDPFADNSRMTKIKWRSWHWFYFTCRDQG